MWTKISFSKACFIAGFLLLSLLCVGTCWANPTYTISESELQTLREHLTMLEQNNNELERLLTESGVDLTTASTALSESRKEIEKLQTQLRTLQEETKRLSASLETANRELQNARESFRQSEKERDKIEGRLRNQRNVWEVLCAIAVGVAVAR